MTICYVHEYLDLRWTKLCCLTDHGTTDHSDYTKNLVSYGGGGCASAKGTYYPTSSYSLDRTVLCSRARKMVLICKSIAVALDVSIAVRVLRHTYTSTYLCCLQHFVDSEEYLGYYLIRQFAVPFPHGQFSNFAATSHLQDRQDG